MKKANLVLTMCWIILGLFGCSGTVFAQSDVYITPPDHFSEDIRIHVDDIVSTKNEYKFKLVLENKSKNKYLSFDLDKTGLNLPEIGKYYPNTRKKPYIIEPDKTKTLIVTIVGGPEVPAGAFDLEFEGLSMGAIPDQNMPISPVIVKDDGTGTAQEFETVDIDVEKASFKKGKYSVVLDIELDQTQNYVNELLIFDGTAVKASSESNPSLEIEASLTTGRKVEVFPGESAKFKFDTECGDPSISVDFSTAFYKIPMEQLDIPTFAISNGRTQHVVRTCPSHTANVDGSIKINVSSEVGCFKFYMMGEEYTPDYTSSLTFMMNPSAKKVKIIMEDGAVAEKTIYAKDDYKALYYTIKQKNGEYDLRYMPGASELADGTPNEVNSGGVSTEGSGRICPAQNANTSGKVAVQLYSEVGCFKVYMQGALMTNGFTSNFTFNTSENVSKKVRLVMEDGGTVEKTLFVGEGYDKLYYEVQLKKGEYSLKNKVFAAEQAEESYQGGSNSGGSGGDYTYCRMSSSSFARLKSTIQEESFDKDKLRIAMHAATNSCLSVYQIKEITQLFKFSAQQLDFAKAAYGNCLNRGEYYEVISVFTFEKDKKELEDYIRSH